MLAAVTLSDDDLAAYQGRMQTLDVYNIPGLAGERRPAEAECLRRL